MRYFYHDHNRQEIGPYTMEELGQLHLNGIIKPDTTVVQEGANTVIVFKELWASSRSAARETVPPTYATTSSQPPLPQEGFTRKAKADLRALIPHLLVPWEEIKTFRWFENRQLLSIAGIGLLPLFIIAVFADNGDIQTSFWAIAFYFSVLWALFFYYVFPTPDIKVPTCVLCFFATGVLSIGLLLMAYKVPPLNWLFAQTRSSHLVGRLFGYIFGVGVPEEACKALILFYIARRGTAQAPQAMLFYGLMAGLGFGIYEGVDYQMERNLRFSHFASEYYLLNMLRLTTLPFLHAIWTGIAGYFICFAHLYPQRKRGLLIVAIGLPALLHGFYDTFSTSVLGLFFALLSVFALYLYLAKTVDLEKVLKEQKLN